MLTTLVATTVNANYHKWYFAAQLDLDDAIRQTQNPGLWREAMNSMSQYDHLRQIALYLLCWGEAAQVRFCLECLCFIFKCADDCYRSPECQNRVERVPEGLYLRAVIKPLYRFIRDQGYEVVDEGIARIALNDKACLVDLPPAQRFMKFDRIDWNQAFFKTYSKKCSIGHFLINFNCIWVIHIAMYYFYTSFNSPSIYRVQGRSLPATTWSAVALSGAIATVIMIMATLARISPRHGTIPRISPAISEDVWRVAGKSRKYSASQTFTASYPALGRKSRMGSMLLWLLVFGCKFIESYFFLTTSFGKPIQVMVGMKIQGCSDRFFGNALCTNQTVFTLTILYIMDLVLFFLDTFLWYIIWNTVFSIAQSFALGLSIWTPWKDIYTRLPKRIYAKLLAMQDMEVKFSSLKYGMPIIISMYREHLLSIDHVQRLLYPQVNSGPGGRCSLRGPPFFISQDDKNFKGEFFPPGSEAERRISFFAQSLTTNIPPLLPVDAMPTFTVLMPHYSGKTLLSLREIIHEEDQNILVTLLEYLKQLHPVEWENFVKDTKILAEECAKFNGVNPFAHDEKGQSKVDDLPFYFIGFKECRTRDHLGMMNYFKAIKLLCRIENPEVVQLFGGNADKLERELERMAGISSMVFLRTLNSNLTICKYTSTGQSLGGQAGCYNLIPVFAWIQRCIISIFLVFMIAFLPLFLQELVERGTWKAIFRLAKQFGSLSPIFEIYSTQIYTHSILSNLTFGGARYIATGHGFTTTRIYFSILFSRFAGPAYT
ncbi:1,3-beta-glucan synthase component-domain-containing protein [Gymnopilus junonius]|uniref:1,3-beta-glucan synthase n=1 Tax=Gymnopilus junonius TaxID=109634 RepID=A0A9P5N8A5_GYMJU|nr:1,3-beta-glucan synthase component-domain-containing protein [Gymnopilus junonius]